jgi:cell division septation protein DedD
MQTNEVDATTPTPEATSKTAAVVQKFRVYLGGFFSRGDAEATQDRLKAQGYNSIIKQSSSGFEVQLGIYNDEATAKSVATSTGASLETF